MNKRFDVFLSHNSKDKPAVRELAEALRARGLKVWLDEWELVPGRPWQVALEKTIETIGSSAVLVGKDGFGPWQDREMRGCLNEFVRRELPVIPVLLPGAPEAPKLPIFLNEFTWVDLRGGLTEEGLDRLQWGITGEIPARSKRPVTSPVIPEAVTAPTTAPAKTPATPEIKVPATATKERLPQKTRARWGALAWIGLLALLGLAVFLFAQCFIRSAQEAQEAVALRDGAAQLQQAEGFLQRVIDDAEELVHLDLAGQRSSPRFAEIFKGGQETMFLEMQRLYAYLIALKASPNAEFRQHAADALARLDEAILVGRPSLAAVTVEEIRWTLERLEERRGCKLSLVLSPDQLALHTEAAELAGELDRLRHEGAGLVELVRRRILAAEGFDLEPLEAALDKVKEDTDRLAETDWSQAGNKLEDRVREAIAGASSAERKRLEDTVLPEVLALKVLTRELRSFAELASTARGLRVQLEATAGQDPTSRLLSLLPLLQAGPQLANGELFADGNLKGWQEDVEALRKELGEVRELDDLPEEVKDDLAVILPATVDGQLGDLATHLQELRAVVDGLLGRFQQISLGMAGVPALAVALHGNPPTTADPLPAPSR